MRENTGRISITTINFANGETASHEWTPAEVYSLANGWGGEEVIDRYAEAHEENRSHPEYVREYGVPQVFEYELPGLRVVVLLTDAAVDTVFVIEHVDVTRLHTAVRDRRPVTIRYVKADGTVTRRNVEPSSLRVTKAGDVVLRAWDRRRGEERTFRLDRITHTTLHRSHFTPAAPSKATLWTDFTRSQADSRPAVKVGNWDGTERYISAADYDALMTARDPREPSAADEAMEYLRA